MRSFPQNTLLGELPADRKVKPFERIDWGGKNYQVRPHRSNLGLFDVSGLTTVFIAPVVMLSDIELLLGIPSVRPVVL